SEKNFLTTFRENLENIRGIGAVIEGGMGPSVYRGVRGPRPEKEAPNNPLVDLVYFVRLFGRDRCDSRATKQINARLASFPINKIHAEDYNCASGNRGDFHAVVRLVLRRCPRAPEENAGIRAHSLLPGLRGLRGRALGLSVVGKCVLFRQCTFANGGFPWQ